ncbi:bifunctional helix-turn-helix transcriptional regulator/GNAT family N-acetyltransferase [Alkalihalobacillus sp. AL-G]|uniref:bifunctional helix-turn-helix transcriptional regulator/GNAT family N-acetyltransferase n=1 Tax=Alkalihalobacillus sp. AL-G TaxID=2926399 RepID=UPI00272CEA82|nr:bifunctional helix-turn-helix transcriptional regulator/GNAT family N-acetyltransferase [Alkalihalobacillus sp. AL-G]WLD94606.1 bifunctional helix-turn-helix transcriptional regulator/GNAT family N-acetyltransferase [Alkalihalobacillus sp. AL-G]
MKLASLEERINSIRHFNRFITRRIGVLKEGLLHSSYSPTESRVIFEIAQKNDMTSSDLIRELGLDAGYMSRILSHLVETGVLEKKRSEVDGRQRILRLTEKGKKDFALLNERSFEEIQELLMSLDDCKQQQLLDAMQTIEHLLNGQKGLKFSEPYFLREHQSGDMGWIVYKHGVLYADEYGWGTNFEALVSQLAADFIKNYRPERERCWIAEMNGENVGSVLLTEESETAARLRLLLVDPKARGLGLGTKLVEECIQFARRKGYKTLVLWTNDVLTEARNIYKKTGFQLIAEEKHSKFGDEMTGETWELKL